MSARPRALVTDAQERSSLAACRGLAAAGYRVSAASGERFAVGHWSRRSHERVTLTGPDGDAHTYVERLSEVLRRKRHDVVLAGAEASLVPISEWRAAIEPYTRLGLPSHEIVLRALDKERLHRHAARVGLEPPSTVACSTGDEALAAARSLGFPLVVKPASSLLWTSGRARHRRAEVVEGVGALEAAVATVGVPLTIQRYVERPTIVSCAAVRIDGALRGLTLVRYARTFPPAVGSAALAVTIEPPRPLIDRIEELLALIGWTGIFELELLELSANRYGAIDFNPRPFGWMALAVGAGANLPALWCDHLLGRESVAAGGARPGVRYRWEEGDARHALARLGDRRYREVAAVLRPHRRVVHALFRVDDPGPLVARLLSAARNVRRRGR